MSSSAKPTRPRMEEFVLAKSHYEFAQNVYKRECEALKYFQESVKIKKQVLEEAKQYYEKLEKSFQIIEIDGDDQDQENDELAEKAPFRPSTQGSEHAVMRMRSQSEDEYTDSDSDSDSEEEDEDDDDDDDSQSLVEKLSVGKSLRTITSSSEDEEETHPPFVASTLTTTRHVSVSPSNDVYCSSNKNLINNVENQNDLKAMMTCPYCGKDVPKLDWMDGHLCNERASITNYFTMSSSDDDFLEQQTEIELEGSAARKSKKRKTH